MSFDIKTIDNTKNIFITTKKNISSYAPSQSRIGKRYPSVKNLLKKQSPKCQKYQKVQPLDNSLHSQQGLNLFLKGGKVLVYNIQTKIQNQDSNKNRKKLDNKINIKKIIQQGRKFFRGNQKIRTKKKQCEVNTFTHPRTKHKSNEHQYRTYRNFNNAKNVDNYEQLSAEHCQINYKNSNRQQSKSINKSQALDEIRSNSFTTIYTNQNCTLQYNSKQIITNINPQTKNVHKLAIRKYTTFSLDEESQIRKSDMLKKNVLYKEIRRGQKNVILKNYSKEKITTSLINIQPIKSRPLFYFNQQQLSNIKAQSFIVTEHPLKQVLVGNSSKKLAEIASLTKIMTFYTIIQIMKQYKKDIDVQIILIDEHIQSMSGTSAELCQGDQYTVKQLLYGMMLPSGNDAAIALAKWGGSIIAQENKQQIQNKSKVKSFLLYMNKCAKNIGMKLSKFANPHGLPNSNSLSNPQQIALLIHQCLSEQLFRKVVGTKCFKCWTKNGNTKRQVIWQNTNKLLRRDGFIGVKTGVTVTAGPCLATCYENNQKIFIIVLLRTSKLSRRFKQTRYILAMVLQKIDSKLYKKQINSLYQDDPQLDSDNSEQQQQFDYQRKDPGQISKRNKILAFEM